MTTADAPKVFISYRREGTAMHAGRLYDATAARFGDPNVFMDLEMAPGVDFVERITSAVGSCRVLLVVIGPEWMGADGSRLADPADFVRLEVETALAVAHVTVIPVLVAGARMPEPHELPEGLRPLARRNAIELTDLRWRYDCQRLMTALEELLAESPQRDSSDRRPAPPDPATRAVASVGALVPLWLEGVAVAVVAGVLARLLGGLIRPGQDPSPAVDVLVLVARRAVVWAAVAGALALWLSLRRGDQGRLLRRVAIGLVYGALAGALGGLVFALATRVPAIDLSSDQRHAAAVASLAITGGLLGMGLGALWVPPRAVAGLLAGAFGGAFVQLLFNRFTAPPSIGKIDGDVVAVGYQCLAVFGFALLVLLMLDVRTAASRSRPAVAAPEAARA